MSVLYVSNASVVFFLKDTMLFIRWILKGKLFEFVMALQIRNFKSMPVAPLQWLNLAEAYYIGQIVHQLC